MQIGDGGIVLDFGEGYELAIEPMVGEYANMTHFVTDEDAVRILSTSLYQNVALRVAAFTDGVQRLALNLAESSPHAPFFDPFFRVLENTQADMEDALGAALRRFLQSDAVNERTDDDKTLIFALRVD
jgi:hypothetical protein